MKKRDSVFKKVNLILAIILTARIFLPFVNIYINGILYFTIFVVWILFAIISYMPHISFRFSEIYLLVFPLLFTVYIVISNVFFGDGMIYTDDFIHFVSFTIPIYIMLFYLKYDTRNLKRISIFSLLFLLITIATTTYHLQEDFYYSKLMSSTGGENVELWIKNIANINIIVSSIVFIIGSFYCFFIRKEQRFISLIMSVSFFIFAIEASFSLITIFVFFGSIVVFIVNKKNLLLIASIVLIVLILNQPLYDIIYISSEKMNPLYEQRVKEILNFIYNSSIDGDLGARFDLYFKSLDVFYKKPFFGLSTGEYFNRTQTLGYHSELFDSLGRYGLFGTLFLALYFYHAVNTVSKKLKNKEKRIYIISSLLVLLYSSVNPIFTATSLSVALFLVLPYQLISNRKISGGNIHE